MTDKEENSSRRKAPKWIIFLVSLIGLLYLLNPTFGFFELIPDNIPFIGNLDEGAAAILVWQGLSELIHSRKSRSR